MLLRTALGREAGCRCCRCAAALERGDETRRLSCPSSVAASAPAAASCPGSCLAAVDGSGRLLLPCDTCGATPEPDVAARLLAAEAQTRADLEALEASMAPPSSRSPSDVLAALAALPPPPHPLHTLAALRANIAMTASDEAGDALGAADAIAARLACRRAILGGLPVRSDAFLAQNEARMLLRAAAGAASPEAALALRLRAQVRVEGAAPCLPVSPRTLVPAAPVPQAALRLSLRTFEATDGASSAQAETAAQLLLVVQVRGRRAAALSAL